MTDPRCGTPAGYQAHVKARTPCCRPCLDAQAKWQRDYRTRMYFAGGKLTIDGTGTRRRLQALARVGWTYDHIADELNVVRSAVQQWTQNTRVKRATAAKVDRLYRAWSDTPGPSRPAAHRAELAGWPAPIAWDDDTIDDPAAKAYAGETADMDEIAIHRAMRGDQSVQLTRQERLTAVRLLTERGHSAAEIAALLGKHQRAVVRDRAEASA